MNTKKRYLKKNTTSKKYKHRKNKFNWKQKKYKATKKNKRRFKKFTKKKCKNKMDSNEMDSNEIDSNEKFNLEELEMRMLHAAVQEAEEKNTRKLSYSDDIKEMIYILEDFIRDKELICYGGTAINNILPLQDQFYNKELEIPDYDFFSPTAMKHVKQLADIYYKLGYKDIEAKAGLHTGTYKLFVNFIHIADVTQQDLIIFNNLKTDGMKINGIYYAPVNFLRLFMFLELSRPKGDVSRWEKVLRRLVLLNKHYPLNYEICSKKNIAKKYKKKINLNAKIQNIIKNSLINQGVVFFGGFALSFYKKYMQNNQKKIVDYLTDFDVISEDPLVCTTILKERLEDAGFKNVKIIKKKGLDDIIPEHYELVVNKESYCFIYKPLACHGYNVIMVNGDKINIASIETTLSFYLAFLYIKRPYYNIDRIMCLSQYLFMVLQKNRLKNSGILKRFTTECYGKQITIEDIKSEKSKRFVDFLKSNKGRPGYRNNPYYQKYFLNYKPSLN